MPISCIDTIRLLGSPENLDDLSGLAIYGDCLFIVNDEDDRVRRYRKTPTGYQYDDTAEFLMNTDRKEADLEGIAIDGNRLSAVGSHACKRKKPKDNLTEVENRQRIERIEPAGPRDVLCRFELDDQGNVKSRESGSLREILNGIALLQPFLNLPSKENGVDIEGMTAVGNRLFFGFRGPVLHDGLVPVLECKWKDRIKFEHLHLIDLDGRGIRDLTRISDGFLIVGGAMNSLDADFALFWWNGVGKFESEKSVVCELGRIPVPHPKAKAEGIFVESETPTDYNILVAFDGILDGAITRMRVGKTR